MAALSAIFFRTVDTRFYCLKLTDDKPLACVLAGAQPVNLLKQTL